MMYDSLLKSQPPPPDMRDLQFGLGFAFRGSADNKLAVLSVLTADAAQCKEVPTRFEKFAAQGLEYLKGHDANLMFAVPRPDAEHQNLRLHVRVRFVEAHKDDSELATEHLMDFDHLMYVVQDVIGEMVEAGTVKFPNGAVDIVSEPLSLKGELIDGKINQVGDAIETWLTYKHRSVFSSARIWNPDAGAWDEGRGSNPSSDLRRS